MLKLVLFTALALGLTILPALAGEEVTADQKLGEKLVHRLWVDMKSPDMAHLNKTISPAFQSVHGYGADNREQELELIKGLKLGNYTLSDIKVTRDGPVIVVTYLVSVAETIKGQRLYGKPAPRMSVFLETVDGWKWIAHANLKPVK